MNKRNSTILVKGGVQRIRGLERGGRWYKCIMFNKSPKLSRSVTFKGQSATEYYYEYNCKFARVKGIVVLQYSMLRKNWMIISPSNINKIVK